MKTAQTREQLIKLLADLDEEAVLKLVRKRIRAGDDALHAQAQEQRCSFPIIIGGGMIDEQVCRYVGADYWVNNAMDGVRLCQRLLAA